MFSVNTTEIQLLATYLLAVGKFPKMFIKWKWQDLWQTDLVWTPTLPFPFSNLARYASAPILAISLPSIALAWHLKLTLTMATSVHYTNHDSIDLYVLTVFPQKHTLET